MIEERFVNFNSRAEFERQYKAGNIKPTSIVFIKEGRMLWTHNCGYRTMPEPEQSGLILRSGADGSVRWEEDVVVLDYLSLFDGNGTGTVDQSVLSSLADALDGRKRLAIGITEDESVVYISCDVFKSGQLYFVSGIYTVETTVFCCIIDSETGAFESQTFSILSSNDIVQTTGNNENKVMSQKAVSEAIGNLFVDGDTVVSSFKKITTRLIEGSNVGLNGGISSNNMLVLTPVIGDKSGDFSGKECFDDLEDAPFIYMVKELNGDEQADERLHIVGRKNVVIKSGSGAVKVVGMNSSGLYLLEGIDRRENTSSTLSVSGDYKIEIDRDEIRLKHDKQILIGTSDTQLNVKPDEEKISAKAGGAAFKLEEEECYASTGESKVKLTHSGVVVTGPSVKLSGVDTGNYLEANGEFVKLRHSADSNFKLTNKGMEVFAPLYLKGLSEDESVQELFAGLHRSVLCDVIASLLDLKIDLTETGFRNNLYDMCYLSSNQIADGPRLLRTGDIITFETDNLGRIPCLVVDVDRDSDRVRFRTILDFRGYNLNDNPIKAHTPIEVSRTAEPSIFPGVDREMTKYVYGLSAGFENVAAGDVILFIVDPEFDWPSGLIPCVMVADPVEYGMLPSDVVVIASADINDYLWKLSGAKCVKASVTVAKMIKDMGVFG